MTKTCDARKYVNQDMDSKWIFKNYALFLQENKFHVPVIVIQENIGWFIMMLIF